MKARVHKKVRNFPKGSCRSIYLNREAAYEIIREYMFENMQNLFDLVTTEEVEMCMLWEPTDDCFICVAYNRNERDTLPFDTIAGKRTHVKTTVFTSARLYEEIKY